MNVRVLTITDTAAAEREMASIGCDPYGISVMAPKAVMRTVLLEGVDNRAANLVKQEMLALGGDAAVNRDVSCFKKGVSRVLVMGTARQLTGLVAKLTGQPFGLKQVAAGIQDALSNYVRSRFRVPLGGYTLELGDRTLVMGILNVTPDSFSDGGMYLSPERAAERAEEMVLEGAAIIDVGGESTRPGAKAVPAREEAARVVPVIRRIARRLRVPISIDTYKPEVARAALDAGACIVNDITGLRHGRGAMAAVARDGKAAVVIQHMQGRPRTMQRNPRYGDVVGDVAGFLAERVSFAVGRGIRSDRIIIDPGIGFGKTPEHNLALLQRLGEFRALGYPLLVGVSRKKFIGRILGDVPPERRLFGSIAGALEAAARGAHIVRAHDVAATVQALALQQAITTAPVSREKER